MRPFPPASQEPPASALRFLAAVLCERAGAAPLSGEAGLRTVGDTRSGVAEGFAFAVAASTSTAP